MRASLADSMVRPAIFVCLPQDRDNFDTAVRLHDRLGAEQLGEVPIHAWIPRQPALAELLRGDPHYARTLFAFGECRHSASLQEVTQPSREDLAQALHRDYRRQWCGEGDTRPACREWSELREDLRASNRAAADHAAIKLAAAGCSLKRQAEITSGDTVVTELAEGLTETLAQMEHNRWVAERLLIGWRYAAERCDQKKTHPDLVPWEALPDERRARDRAQIAQLFRVLNERPYAVVRNSQT
jgi:hypothetical protein